MRTFYHGTSASRAAAILKEGLQPRKVPGTDAFRAVEQPKWAQRVARTDAKFPERERAVFLTTRLKTAELFALYAALHTRSRPKILEVHLPDSEPVSADTLSEDDLFAFQHVGPIPPKFIKPLEAH